MSASISQGRPVQMYVERHDGDPDEPTLLLLHGLGGTGQVWDRMLDVADWAGPIVVPDLRGHGATDWTDTYSFGAMAADVADVLPQGATVVAMGHSMGGVVAMTLASGWFSIDVAAVMTIGVKVEWSDEEIAAIETIAAKPTRTFDTRDEAVVWGMKLAGLHGGVEVDDPITERLVRPRGDEWIAALDPRAGTVGAPALGQLHAAFDIPCCHVAGDSDAMTNVGHLGRFGVPTVELSEAGHNAMVDQPAAAWAAMRNLLA